MPVWLSRQTGFFLLSVARVLFRGMTGMMIFICKNNLDNKMNIF